MTNIHNNLIRKDQSLRDALKLLNEHPPGMTLFVLDEEDRLVGTLTDGDVRRGLMESEDIGQPVKNFMNRDFHYLKNTEFSIDEVEHYMEEKIWLVPLLDDNHEIIRVFNLKNKRTILPVDVVIMAGGRGKRLRPLTEDTPKPLLKVGEKPIIEHNIERLHHFGINHYHITVNYLADKVRSYLGDGRMEEVEIDFVEEEEPMGTMGALSLIDNFTHDNILLMNCDLLTNINYLDFYKEFKEKDADISVATVPYKVQIPYAVLETNHEEILSFTEKPTYTYYSNAGIYLFKKELIELLPDEESYDVTDFLEELLSRDFKITYYPILDYWLDIGKHEDYEKAQEDIKHINILA